MKPIIIIALLLPLSTLAQQAFFIRPVVSYANTNLYNAEDGPKSKNRILSTNPLPYKTSFSPSVGLQVGYHFGNEKTALLF